MEVRIEKFIYKFISNYYNHLFFNLINLAIFKIDGMVIIINATIKIKSKSKFDTPYLISYL